MSRRHKTAKSSQCVTYHWQTSWWPWTGHGRCRCRRGTCTGPRGGARPARCSASRWPAPSTAAPSWTPAWSHSPLNLPITVVASNCVPTNWQSDNEDVDFFLLRNWLHWNEPQYSNQLRSYNKTDILVKFSSYFPRYIITIRNEN